VSGSTAVEFIGRMQLPRGSEHDLGRRNPRCGRIEAEGYEAEGYR
jgi:hypothetical protein